GAGADRAHQHDGGGAVAPALAHVRAVGFLTDSAQPMFADVALDRFEAVARRRLDPQPFGLGFEGSGFRRCGAARLAVLDGSHAPRIAEILTTGDMGWRVDRHRCRTPGRLPLQGGLSCACGRGSVYHSWCCALPRRVWATRGGGLPSGEPAPP